MSVETTNTPSGASNNKSYLSYIKSKQIPRESKTVATTDMAERDPAKDLGVEEVGDNTITETSKLIDVNPGLDQLALDGDINQVLSEYVSIGMTLVGQPMLDSPEAKSAIKLSIEEVKRALQARGALTPQAYAEAKRAKAERGEGEPEVEDHDKDNNGIDDRLE